jgi:hypothetical protein
MTIGELHGERDAESGVFGITSMKDWRQDPAGRAGNFRCYGQDHAELLSFIRHCSSLDMALNEIKILLGFRSAPYENCGEVNACRDLVVPMTGTHPASSLFETSTQSRDKSRFWQVNKLACSSRTEGIDPFHCEAGLTDLWGVRRCNTGELGPDIVNNVEVSVRAVVISQTQIGTGCLGV